MNFRVLAAVLGGAVLCLPVQAQTTVNQTFTVSTTFTQACVADTSGGTPTLSFGTYTAFGAASVSAPTATVAFKCSRGATLVGAAFDNPGGLASGSGTAAGATSATAAGVIAGLRYTMSTTAATKTTSGTAATAAAAGTHDVYSYTVTGAMASGQAGCVAGTASDCTASQTRTLTLTY